MKKDIKKGKQNPLSTFKSIEDVHAYYKKIISCMPNNVYWLNRDCITLGCNNNVLKLFGLKKLEDFVGITYEKMGELGGWVEGQAMSMKNDDIEVMSTGVAKYNVEEPPLYDEKGNPIYYISSRVPLFDDKGTVIGVVGISVDITKQKETEIKLEEQIHKTEKAYRSKGRFIAQASHEIRNPISSVSGSLMLIKERLDKLQVLFYEKFGSSIDKLDPKSIEELNTTFAELFEFYNGATEKTEASLTALKNLEKLHLLEMEGLEPKWELNNISSLIEEAIKQSTYPNNGKVDLKIHIDSNVPDEAIIDYNHIHDALSIFIGNAIRFSSPTQQVLIGVQTNGVSYLDFTVQDFGVGISKEQLNDLFKNSLEEEYTIDARLKKPSVQLKRAKLMVEASGGNLAIKSILKLGTTVTIKVPYRLSNDQTIKPKNKDYILKELTRLLQCKILIIEDELSIQRATLKQLNELGFNQIDVASNGNEAIEKGMKNNYDIIFVDFTLPDINGIKVVEHLLKQKNENIIFIGITSHTSEETETHALKQGVMEVLFKPVSKAQLAQALYAALQIIQENRKQII